MSTLPLPYLLDILSHCPFELKQLASELEAVSLKILMLLIRPSGELPQRVYIADPDIPAHKVAFNHTSSPSLSRREHHAVMCEVSYSAFKQIPDDRDLLSLMIQWMIDSDYIKNEEDVVETNLIDVALGYPVNTHNKSSIVSDIKGFLADHGIYTIGRFGAWDYANSDECIRQGLALADELHAIRSDRRKAISFTSRLQRFA